jgi:bacteriorhodopsin
MDSNVTFSTNLSIIVQFLTGVIAFIGLFISLAPEDIILLDILKIELVVQVIEFSFYIFVLQGMAETAAGMAAARYFDWFITTPTMLFTIIVYFKYEEYKQNNDKNKLRKPLNIIDFIKENETNIKHIFVFNLLMLLFGYLGETGVISFEAGAVFGFFAFILAFENIYLNYAANSTIGKNLYLILFALWAMYGVAYLFPIVAKNNTFNILDLFAKNFFGVFLYFKIKQERKIKNNIFNFVK